MVRWEPGMYETDEWMAVLNEDELGIDTKVQQSDRCCWGISRRRLWDPHWSVVHCQVTLIRITLIRITLIDK